MRGYLVRFRRVPLQTPGEIPEGSGEGIPGEVSEGSAANTW